MKSDQFFGVAEAIGKVAFQFDLQKKRFTYLSNNTEHLVGLPSQQLQTNPELLLGLLYPEESEALLQRLKNLSAGHAATNTVKIKSAAQTPKYLKLEACILPDADNFMVAGFVQDITREVEYEAHLLEYARRKDSVLAIVAHDLKAPIAHIQSAAGQISKEQDAPNTETNKLYSIIDQACADSIRLINDLLRDEHMNSQEIAAKKELLDVGQLMQRLLTPFIATDKLNHRFELLCPDHKIIAELDELKLMQIMNNLIINSVKFTPGGGFIRIEIRSDKNCVYITHSDSGIGIPDTMMPHIFEAYKSGRIGLRGEPSSGVGLSIVRQLVEIQGGNITVKTSADTGTVFSLVFPLTNSGKSQYC